MKSLNKKESVSFLLNIPEELNDEITKLAKKRGVTKTSFIMFAISFYIDYNSNLAFMSSLPNILKELSMKNDKK